MEASKEAWRSEAVVPDAEAPAPKPLARSWTHWAAGRADPARDAELRECRRVAAARHPLSVKERYAIFAECFPLAIFSTLCSVVFMAMRRFDLVPEVWLAAIEHPYAAQVFGFIVGYLMVMRLSMALQRWDHGMSSVLQMECKWRDAFTQLSAFLAQAEHDTSDAHTKVLVARAQLTLVHLFSLLHALSVSNLCFAEGQPYGRMSAGGRELFAHLDYVPLDLPLGASATRALLLADERHEERRAGAERAQAGSWWKRRLLGAAVGSASKRHWPFALQVFGTLDPDEGKALLRCQDQNGLVMTWVTQVTTHLVASGLITTPAPIISRVFQELSNGMLGYVEAYKVAVLPFPASAQDISYTLLMAVVLIIPCIVEKFTNAVLLTPMLTFASTFGLLVTHSVTVELEMPFGQDFIDLPLQEMHEAFNASLLREFEEAQARFMRATLGRLSQESANHT